MVSIQVTHSSY